MPETTPVTAPDVRFDWWKYTARSFLLPVLTAGATFYLALSWGPERIDAVVKVGALLAAVAGVFNVTEAWKTAAVQAAGKDGAQ